MFSRNRKKVACALAGIAAACLAGCGEDERVPQETRSAFTPVSTESVGLCHLVGGPDHPLGVYGSDLGFSFPWPQGGAGSSESGARIGLLFGDTWNTATSVCDYPIRVSDDLQASLPAARPAVLTPGPGIAPNAALACAELLAPPSDPGESAPRPIRLFRDAGERRPEALLDMSAGRTPVAAFSDGRHAFGLFNRAEVVSCDTSADCPNDLVCTADPGYRGPLIGFCSPVFQLSFDPIPVPCHAGPAGVHDCGANRTCVVGRGVCRAKVPFEVATDQGAVSPNWYDLEPEAAIAQVQHIASAFWPDRPEDYASGYRFVTNKFVNPALRTVAFFDPDDPSRNDYRPGTHTLLFWGRPVFQGRKGVQPLLFLLYQPLGALLDDQGHIHWSPHYFAGYRNDGKPRWSEHEADAVPVYGADVTRDADGGVRIASESPEFDVVNQMTVSYVEPLGRWMTFYGGDLARWLRYDPGSQVEIADTNPAPVPGAVHMRYASHPWGRSTRDAPVDEAWSKAEAVFTREQAAPYLGCEDQTGKPPGCTDQHDPHRPLQMLLEIDARPSIPQSDWADVTASCLNGNALRQATYALSGDSSGHLYGADIIEPWTTDVTGAVPDRGGGKRVIDVYWNVSTWNPYGVILVKTEIVAEPSSAEH